MSDIKNKLVGIMVIYPHLKPTLEGALFTIERQEDALSAADKELKEAREESNALRSMLNIYNLGGWTDAEGMAKELSALREKVDRIILWYDGLSERVFGSYQSGFGVEWAIIEEIRPILKGDK